MEIPAAARGADSSRTRAPELSTLGNRDEFGRSIRQDMDAPSESECESICKTLHRSDETSIGSQFSLRRLLRVL